MTNEHREDDVLTPTMERCLAAVTAEQGQSAKRLPGGVNTVWALMRRGLVETDVDQTAWRVFLPAHPHVFQTTLQLDGCHHWKTCAKCDCGVVYGAWGERKGDPYSAMWFNIDGDGEACSRCEALLRGARPRAEVVIQRPREYSPPLAVVA